MIAAVTGGRDLCVTPELACAFWVALDHYNVTVLRHGACRGADAWAASSAAAMGRVVEAWPADWGKHGGRAGPIRNRAMLSGEPDALHALKLAFGGKLAGLPGVVDLLLAFPGGRGTADCIAAARDFGIAVVPLWR